MFGLLKKKIGEFIGKLTSKEEEKDEPEVPIPVSPEPPEKTPAAKPEGPGPQKPAPPTGPSLLQKEESRPSVQPIPSKPTPPSSLSDTAATEPKVQPAPRVEKPAEKATPSKTAEPSAPSHPIASKPEIHTPGVPAQVPKIAIHQEKTPLAPERILPAAPVSSAPKIDALPPEPKGERKLEPKIGLLSRIKSVFTHEVQIQEKEITPLLDDLHWALLESDVSLDTAEHISGLLKADLVGQKIQKDQLQTKVKQAVRSVLRETIAGQSLDVVEYVRAHEKPVKILFLGPNGAGKTTTIAKIAHHLRAQGLSVVLAAGDTFRAAAIEQLTHHAGKLGVKIVKHQYAADPAAVAFDAIAHAKAHQVDVVLIDTAGRQETNFNLLKEMEKINRVVRPDLKLFVGEAVAGHAIVEQAKSFHQALNLDGIVLTKLDCDAKGGTSFSLVHEVKVPIVFLGVGQEYGDLRPFDADWIVDNVLSE